MRANSSQINLNYDRQKEFQRQQERLKAMANNGDSIKVKSVTADIMIENLIKDSARKPSLMTSPRDNLNVHLELPTWLQCESPLVPTQYKYLWSLVQATLDVADTQKVSHLLLTSGLHIDVLGYIWNLANKTIPGQLTKQEFYIVLTLVSLAQTGCTFNNLGVLKLVPGPCIPVLQVDVLQNHLPQTNLPKNDAFHSTSTFSVQNHNVPPSNPLTLNAESVTSFSACSGSSNFNTSQLFSSSVVDMKSDKAELNITPSNNKVPKVNDSFSLELNNSSHKTSNFPCIGSSPTEELEDDFSEFQSVPVERTEKTNKSSESGDEFTDFQAAKVENADPFETIVISQRREIPKISLPKTLSGKFTTLKSNLLKISPESEKKLKVLTQSESLSSLPESKISSTNKVSTTLSVLGSNHGIGSRLANHSFNKKLEKPKTHKHHKIKINPTPSANSIEDEEVIFGVKTSNLENQIPKCCPKKTTSSKTFVLKETKIRSNEDSEVKTIDFVENKINISPLHSAENTRQIDIPMLGKFNETVLPTQTKTSKPSVDLLVVQEDKYSALRDLECSIADTNTESKNTSEEINDEFGDFLSADIPTPITVLETDSPVEKFQTTISATEVLNTDKECWGDWSFNNEINLTKTNSTLQDSSATNIEEQLNAVPKGPTVTETDLFDSFSLLNSKEENTKVNGLGTSDFFGSLLNSNIDPSKELSSKEESVQENQSYNDIFDVLSNSTSVIEPLSFKVVKNDGDSEEWDFMAAPPQNLTPSLSRHNSITSLDLKILPSEEVEMEIIWKKCLQSCQNLIQEGFEIFNSITDKPVLDEVFLLDKTSAYLKNLNIVYQIFKRISQNCNDTSSTKDINTFWRKLEDLYSEYDIKFLPDPDTVVQSNSQCNICLGYIGKDVVNQGSHSYHPSCANLWINCVEGVLPYPS